MCKILPDYEIFRSFTYLTMVRICKGFISQNVTHTYLLDLLVAGNEKLLMT